MSNKVNKSEVKVPSNRPPKSNWVIQAPGEIERIEAFFSGVGFVPHRHDTYAIGWTVSGVQSFDYRGVARYSLPGRTVVLHPDEKHDGRAGTDVGFQYRVIYIEPATIQSILGGKPLPFIEGGISLDPQLYQVTSRLLGDLDNALDPLEYQDTIYDLANALDVASGSGCEGRKNFDYQAASLAQQFLADNLHQNITLDDLERITGRDRWKLSRDFSALYGTSPYRYLVMRRLEQACAMMVRDHPLSQVAMACNFADQSHMNRHFKKTYGMTPKQWLKTLGDA